MRVVAQVLARLGFHGLDLQLDLGDPLALSCRFVAHFDHRLAEFLCFGLKFIHSLLDFDEVFLVFVEFLIDLVDDLEGLVTTWERSHCLSLKLV